MKRRKFRIEKCAFVWLCGAGKWHVFGPTAESAFRQFPSFEDARQFVVDEIAVVAGMEATA